METYHPNPLRKRGKVPRLRSGLGYLYLPRALLVRASLEEKNPFDVHSISAQIAIPLQAVFSARFVWDDRAFLLELCCGLRSI